MTAMDYTEARAYLAEAAKSGSVLGLEAMRALPAEELARTAQKYIPHVEAAESLAQAVDRSFSAADREGDVILAFGSLSYLGEMIKETEKWRWTRKK